MTITPDHKGHIEPVDFKKALGDRYLSYALSTIMARSLPDVRDGLKPVNRRLLYAMRQLKLAASTAPKKSARIVGDVIGKYHPHGEQAIYSTLVRLAQEFSLRYPLIKGQGNFGNIDGDNAAAMRYTEAKLTEVAESLLADIQYDTVDFKPTYDGGDREPMVLPASFPNLLANGAIGIAVGMATNIPPHNVDELVDAMVYLIKNPEATTQELVQHVKGPDFPTGGILLESEADILKAYETGRGAFRVRAKYEVEDLKNGQYQIIITEIPYQVQKSKLVEKIADLMAAKKLVLLGDVRDESTEDIRLVLVPKNRNVDPHVLMSTVFKQTDLDTRFSMNMNVLDHNNVPRVMGLKSALKAFLDHRLIVLRRYTQHRLDKIAERMEVLAGYILVYLHMDEVIRIIRFDDTPKETMMAKWRLTDLQAEAILNMRLRSLQKLEELALKKEHDELGLEKEALQGLLENEALCWDKIQDQLQALKQKFGKQTALGARRTEIGAPVVDVDVPIEALVEKEPVTVICSQKGWVRVLKGHVTATDDIKYKEGDQERFVLPAENVDYLLVFVKSGRFFTLNIDQLPKGRGVGEPLNLLLDKSGVDDVVALFVHKRGSATQLLLASDDGRGFIVNAEEVLAQTKNGKQVLNVTGDHYAKVCVPVTGDRLAVVGQNRRLLIFEINELPEMARGRGVMLQKYRGGGLSDLLCFKAEEGLSWQKGTRTYREPEWEKWLGKRGAAGRFAPQGFPKSNKFSA